MRRFEHTVIAALLAALAALSYMHFRSPRPAVNAPRESVSSQAPKSSAPASSAAEAPSPETGTSETPPAESADERRAREYAEARRTQAALEEAAQLDGLLELAKKLIAEGGVDALFWSAFPAQEGSGNDDDLRRLVAEFEKETDPARLWALAQRIRFHLTDRRGSIWTIDSEAYRIFEKWASADGDPLKRGIALGSAGATGWGDETALNRHRLLNDADERVRATAASLLPAPKGVSADNARPVADRYRELLASPDANIRAAAAKGFGPWAFRPADVDALIQSARSDSSESVRIHATRSLAASGSDSAREALAGIAKDPTQPAAVLDAAREALGSGVVPEGIEEVRAIRAGPR